MQCVVVEACYHAILGTVCNRMGLLSQSCRYVVVGACYHTVLGTICSCRGCYHAVLGIVCRYRGFMQF